jgi:hypothetical protein
MIAITAGAYNIASKDQPVSIQGPLSHPATTACSEIPSTLAATSSPKKDR